MSHCDDTGDLICIFMFSCVLHCRALLIYKHNVEIQIRTINAKTKTNPGAYNAVKICLQWHCKKKFLQNLTFWQGAFDCVVSNNVVLNIH